MSRSLRSPRRSVVVVPLAAALLAACAGSPTEPGAAARLRRPALDSLPIRNDPRPYGDSRGVDLFEYNDVLVDPEMGHVRRER